jgi:hypothetical protein
MRGMNTDAHIGERDDPAIPAGLCMLWAEAHGWVAWLLSMFDRTALRTTGVNREHGARLTHWLTNIEGAVRRLILAAALALVPPASRRSASPAPTRQKKRATPTRRPGFRVFRLHRTGAPRSGPAPSPRQPAPYGHVLFRADPLLTLGAAPARSPRSHAPRARNPLDRWVRLSRDDPDWRPPEESGAFLSGRELRPTASRSSRRPPARDALPGSLWDWRRRHDEWRKIVPAPGLAARLEALVHVIANPGAAIASAARRLRRPHNSGPAILRDAIPRWRPPRRAEHIATAGHTSDLNDRCHDALVSSDTS